MNTTTYIRYEDPTMHSQASQAYSQCMPEPDYGYGPQSEYGYGSYYNEQAPMSQQPVPVQPVQAPVAQSSSSAGKGLLMVAGLAVVGAAAFGGVMLMNSSSTQTTPTAASSAVPADASAPVVNLPESVEVASPAPQNGPASVPVIINNPAPVRVSGPAFSAPKQVTVPNSIAAPNSVTGPAPALAPAPGPAPASVPGGVTVKTPGVEVGVPREGGVSVKTPGVDVAVPGQGQGGVVVAVPDDTKKDETKTDAPTNPNADPNTGADMRGMNPNPPTDNGTAGKKATGVTDGANAAAANVTGTAGG